MQFLDFLVAIILMAQRMIPRHDFCNQNAHISGMTGLKCSIEWCRQD